MSLLPLVLAALSLAAAGDQSGPTLTQPLEPERTLDTASVFGFPLSIIQPVELDGYIVTEEFLLRDDLRGDASSNLYYVVALRPDGPWCSPGWHPHVALPPSWRRPLDVWTVRGVHKLVYVAAKGVVSQFPLPSVTDRCLPK